MSGSSVIVVKSVRNIKPSILVIEYHPFPVTIPPQSTLTGAVEVCAYGLVSWKWYTGTSPYHPPHKA